MGKLEYKLQFIDRFEFVNLYDNFDKDVALKSWKYAYFGIAYQNIAANF